MGVELEVRTCPARRDKFSTRSRRRDNSLLLSCGPRLARAERRLVMAVVRSPSMERSRAVEEL